jgi:hypothetical protein
VSATAAVRPFKRLGGLGQALRVLLAVGILLDVVNIVVTFLEVQIVADRTSFPGRPDLPGRVDDPAP